MDGTPYPCMDWLEQVCADCHELGWDGDWDGRLDGPLYAFATRVKLDLGVSSPVGCSSISSYFRVLILFSVFSFAVSVSRGLR